MPTENELKEQVVRQALDQYTPLQVWGSKVAVRANGNKIVLSGVVRTRAIKQVAEKLTKQVQGVSSVENHLVADDQIEAELAEALGRDERTRAGFPGVVVGVVFGTAFLKGTAHSAAMKSAAVEIASKFPGVTCVSDELAIAA